MILLTIFILTNALHYADNYMQSIAVIQNDPDHLALILMIKDNQQTSDQALSIIQEYQKEVDDIVNIVVINCSIIDRNELIHLPGCQNEEYLPFAMYLIPPTTFDDPKKIRPKEKLLPGLSLNLLRTEFQNNSPRFWITIQNRGEYELWLQNTKMNKVLTSLQQPPLWWFGITQKYRDRLDFAIIHPSIQSEDLLILKLVNNQYETQHYKGPRRYESLRAYLSKFARQNRIIDQGLKKEEKIVTKIQKINEIDHHNQWVLVYFSNGKHNQKYNQITKDMSGLFQIYEIENSQKQEQLLIFPFSSKDNPIQIKNQNILQICAQLVDLIPNKLITNTHELLNQISQIIATKKILITLFYQKQQFNQCHFLWAQTLANKMQFKNLIEFYTIIDPDESFQKQYSITNYPQLSSLQIDNGKISQINYNNYFTYEGFEEFLINVIHKQNKNEDKLQIAHNQQEFELFCQQGKTCIIGLIDLTNEADQDALLKAMKAYDYNSIWILVDSRCQSLLISKYKLNPPQLLIYDMNNYLLSIMPQKLNIRNIELFLKQKKKKWREIDFEIEIQKCNLRDDL